MCSNPPMIARKNQVTWALYHSALYACTTTGVSVLRPSAAARSLALARSYGTQTYGTTGPGGSRARRRARARAEQPTWAHRVWYQVPGNGRSLGFGDANAESQTHTARMKIPGLTTLKARRTC